MMSVRFVTGKPEQGVPDDEACVIVGHMGKLQSARHIANRIDMFLR